ncbi:MAG: hypothetical protein ACOYK9_00620 [Chlamydiia bacterium]
MRYIYLAITVLFVFLGGLYHFHKEEASLTTQCTFCSFHASSMARGQVLVVEPKEPLVDGHMILYVERHFNALNLITAIEKKEMLGALARVDQMYLETYGAIGHTYFVNVSAAGHLFIDVIPKTGAGSYCYFGMKRLLRSFQLKKLDLLIDAKPVVFI